jgi:hypothetical protein
VQARTAHEWPTTCQGSVVPALAQTTVRPLAAPGRNLPLVASAVSPLSVAICCRSALPRSQFLRLHKASSSPRDCFLTSPANSSAQVPLTLRSVHSLHSTNTIINYLPNSPTPPTTTPPTLSSSINLISQNALHHCRLRCFRQHCCRCSPVRIRRGPQGHSFPYSRQRRVPQLPSGFLQACR